MIVAIANFTRPGLSQPASSVRSSKVGLAQILAPALFSSIAVLFLLLLYRGDPKLQAPRDGIIVSCVPSFAKTIVSMTTLQLFLPGHQPPLEGPLPRHSQMFELFSNSLITVLYYNFPPFFFRRSR